ncbi:hypothetical protein KR018_010038 [Drosophila ironensis]|nr:hypothetical protein KR018_010038 [Drosophila ironensis]
MEPLQIIFYCFLLLIPALSASPIKPEDDESCPPVEGWHYIFDVYRCVPCRPPPRCSMFVPTPEVDHLGCPVFKCLESEPICDGASSAKYYTDMCTVCDACSNRPCKEYCEISTCLTNEGDEIKLDGESWTSDNGCLIHTCIEGRVSKTIIDCKHPGDCAREQYIYTDGQCCPTCPEDSFYGPSEGPREWPTEPTEGLTFFRDSEETFSTDLPDLAENSSASILDFTPSQPSSSSSSDSPYIFASSTPDMESSSESSTEPSDTASSAPSTTTTDLSSLPSASDHISKEPDIAGETTKAASDYTSQSTEAPEQQPFGGHPVATDRPKPTVVNQTKVIEGAEPTRLTTNKTSEESQELIKNVNKYPDGLETVIAFGFAVIVVVILLVVLRKDLGKVLGKVFWSFCTLDKKANAEYQAVPPQQPQETCIYPSLKHMEGEAIRKEMTQLDVSLHLLPVRSSSS